MADLGSYEWPPAGGSGSGILQVATYADLPSPIGLSGTIYETLDTNNLWVSNGTSWLLLASPNPLVGHAGQKTIGSGVSSISVTYSTAVGSSNSVSFSFVNTTDTNPIFLIGYISAQSTTGFTVTFNAPTDTANYLINWQVSGAI